MIAAIGLFFYMVLIPLWIALEILGPLLGALMWIGSGAFSLALHLLPWALGLASIVVLARALEDLGSRVMRSFPRAGLSEPPPRSRRGTTVTNALQRDGPPEGILYLDSERIGAHRKFQFCPVCAETIGRASTHACPACDAPHHSDCWTYNGGCARYACGERAAQAEATRSRATSPGRRRRVRSTQTSERVSGAGLAAGATVALGVAAVAGLAAWAVARWLDE